MLYHLSPNGPSPCRAKNGQCPYAKAGEPHFDNIEAASLAYDQKMRDTFNTFETLKKTSSRRLKEAGYKTSENVRQGATKAKDFAFDKMIQTGKLVKASAPVQKTVSTLHSIKSKVAEIKAKVKAQKEKFVARLDEMAREAEQYREIDRQIKARKKEDKLQRRAAQKEVDDFYAGLSAEQKLQKQEHDKVQKAIKKAHRIEKKNRIITGTGETIPVGSMIDNRYVVTGKKSHIPGHYTLTLRDMKTGRFARSINVAKDRQLKFLKPRAARKLSAGSSRVHKDSFSSRIKAAASLQKESWNALRGVKTASNVERGRHSYTPTTTTQRQAQLHQTLAEVSRRAYTDQPRSQHRVADHFADIKESSGLRQYAESLSS